MPANNTSCSPMRQAPRFVCLGCTDVATGEPGCMGLGFSLLPVPVGGGQPA